MPCISGVGVARDQRAYDSHRSFSRTREEIAASPHPTVLRTSTLPIKGRVEPHALLTVRFNTAAASAGASSPAQTTYWSGRTSSRPAS